MYHILQCYLDTILMPHDLWVCAIVSRCTKTCNRQHRHRCRTSLAFCCFERILFNTARARAQAKAHSNRLKPHMQDFKSPPCVVSPKPTCRATLRKLCLAFSRCSSATKTISRKHQHSYWRMPQEGLRAMPGSWYVGEGGWGACSHHGSCPQSCGNHT